MGDKQRYQHTDHVNGEAAAGTKELSKGSEVDVAARIEDGRASDKGYKEPALKTGAK